MVKWSLGQWVSGKWLMGRWLVCQQSWDLISPLAQSGMFHRFYWALVDKFDISDASMFLYFILSYSNSKDFVQKTIIAW